MSTGMIFDEPQITTPICHVCKNEIDDSIHRVVIFQDAEKTPIVKRFHFFFPCWDIEEICKNEANYKIVNAGFSCERSILDSPEKLRNLQNNFSLWG